MNLLSQFHKGVCKHLLDAPFINRFADAPFHELNVSATISLRSGEI